MSLFLTKALFKKYDLNFQRMMISPHVHILQGLEKRMIF